MTDVKALFLGPKAENQDLYESLILEIVRDSCFLRKNFHPQDESVISEKDKLSVDFAESVAQLKQHLQGILSELKKGVPLYHPRYIGHMHGDLLLSGIAAYFATMLYNPNNVVGESSPATTKMELEYINALCKMVGFKSCEKLTGDYSWGHLCSGGTSANIEALWVARNIKYYPLSVKLASLLIPECKYLADRYIRSIKKDIEHSIFKELFNLPVQEVIELKNGISNLPSDSKFKLSEIHEMINGYSVTQLGVYGIHHTIETLENYAEQINLPKVYIAKSNHYSWEKALDVIGIGRNQLMKVEIDAGYRLNMDDLCEKMEASGSPTLAVIGILGSSKQGSIDPIDEIIELRTQKEKENHSFYIHVDGAYGGYFPTVLRKTTKYTNFSPIKEVLDFLKRGDSNLYMLNGKSTINDKWCKKIEAISKTDSITIDPHKMGYIPYPAGSILFSDTQMKDFISYEPSYLNKSANEDDLHNAFLGQWTLEGSRPGAAAAACFLSNKVLPFTQEGHGLLVKNSMHAANRFWNSIFSFNSDEDFNNGFKIVPLYVPETNIISYVLSAPKVITKTKYLNKLNRGLYKRFSVNGDSIIPALDFMIAKDGFKYKDLPKHSVLTSCEIDETLIENTAEEITILSSVFMNPLSICLKDDFYDDYWKEVVKAGHHILGEIMLDIILENNNGQRLKILWAEDDEDIRSLKTQIEYDNAIGRCFDINFVSNPADAQKEIIRGKWDIYIFDLNLKSIHHPDSKKFDLQDSTDIMPTIGLIELIPLEERENILIYSSYLNNSKIKNEHIIPELINLFKDRSKFEEHLISKTGNYIKDKQKIINSIFSISQT